MKVWEYYTLETKFPAGDRELNAYGEKGWELMIVFYGGGRFNYTFKRPKVKNERSGLDSGGAETPKNG